jgi:hypothetical protein
MTRTEVVDRLKASREKLVAAIELEEAGYPLQAHEQLAKFFNDEEVLAYPNVDLVRAEAVRKYLADRRETGTPSGQASPLIGTSTGTRAAAAATGAAAVVGQHPGQAAANTRSWSDA